MKTTRIERTRTGFTLIELLVVIAIISLLAAILFPVFARARENARKASCQNNLKQLALGFHQYIQDYDGYYPYGWDRDLVNGTGYSEYLAGYAGSNEPTVWPAKIEPYLKNRQIFSCPSFVTIPHHGFSCGSEYYGVSPIWKSGDPVIPSMSMGYGSNHGAAYVSYGYNVQYLGGMSYNGSLTCQHVYYNIPYYANPAKDADLGHPTTTICLIDNSYINGGAGTPPYAVEATDVTAYSKDDDIDFNCATDGSYQPYDPLPTRHNNGLNAMFCDGHVKWMKKSVVAHAPTGGIGCYSLDTAAALADKDFLWGRK